jgi:bifunctional DNA-binding transcriptional regulator/antitoxin component of YhaV-PrlF toxin-antitoxin module
MGDSYSARVGNKGRVVLPVGLRESQGWTDDTVLLFIEDQDGVRVMSRDDVMRSIRTQLAGTNVVEDFLAERRAIAAAEDAE